MILVFWRTSPLTPPEDIDGTVPRRWYDSPLLRCAAVEFGADAGGAEPVGYDSGHRFMRQ